MKILLVEDDSRVASFIRRGLRQTNSQSTCLRVVVGSQNGVIQRGQPVVRPHALLTCQVVLPWRPSGKINRAFPVLILTARGAAPDKAELFHQGCDD